MCVCGWVCKHLSNREPDNGEVSSFICTTSAKNNELLLRIHSHNYSEKKKLRHKSFWAKRRVEENDLTPECAVIMRGNLSFFIPQQHIAMEIVFFLKMKEPENDFCMKGSQLREMGKSRNSFVTTRYPLSLSLSLSHTNTHIHVPTLTLSLSLSLFLHNNNDSNKCLLLSIHPFSAKWDRKKNLGRNFFERVLRDSH